MPRKYHKEKPGLFLEEMGIINDIVKLKQKQSDKDKILDEVNFILSKFTIQKMINITNDIYPGFDYRLNPFFSNAKLLMNEKCICCLIFCGFSNTEIALLIHQSKNTKTIEYSKTKIRTKLGIDKYGDIQEWLLVKYDARDSKVTT